MSPVFTIGHGTATSTQLADLLHRAGVGRVVDIRSAPGSRRNPHMARTELERWLPDSGIDYRWDKRLGGFRRVPADSPDTYWDNHAFRAYAGHTRSADFRAAMDELLRAAADVPTAVMCSESVWWRCHRRIVADVATVLHGVAVQHLMHDGRVSDHPASTGARVTGDGMLVYDRSSGCARRPG